MPIDRHWLWCWLGDYLDKNEFSSTLREWGKRYQHPSRSGALGPQEAVDEARRSWAAPDSGPPLGSHDQPSSVPSGHGALRPEALKAIELVLKDVVLNGIWDARHFLHLG